MNQSERDALREKHRETEWGNWCEACTLAEYMADWPCDVIKVLDYLNVVIEDNEQAMEALKGTLEIAQRLAGNL